MKWISYFDSTNEPGLFTPCSVLHFFSGVFAGQAFKHLTNFSTLTSFILWFIIHGLREVKDYRKSKNIKDPYLDDNSLVNCIGDQVISMIGFLVGDYLPTKVSIYYTTLFLVAFIYVYSYTLKLH
jgi:hypothetical protein